jgi:hypothetical protein
MIFLCHGCSIPPVHHGSPVKQPAGKRQRSGKSSAPGRRPSCPRRKQSRRMKRREALVRNAAAVADSRSGLDRIFFGSTHRPGALNSGARAGPFPFSVPLERGDGAPGGATGGSPPVGEPKTGIRRAPRQVPCYQGLPLSGALAKCRWARRLPALQRDAIVGHRILLPVRTPSTRPSQPLGVPSSWPRRLKPSYRIRAAPLRQLAGAKQTSGKPIKIAQ